MSKKILPELFSVSRKAGQAIMDYKMIEEGDKIAVAVSGGKDSVSLMHVLRHRLQQSPVKFRVVAVHIDFELADFNPAELAAYLEKEGFEHHVVKVGGLKGEKREEMDCYRWSAHRRRALFELCKTDGYTKIAFGHHMDDIVETILLNQFFRGEIGAMKPKQHLFGGTIKLIRPLAYVREESMRQLATALGIDGMGQSKCSYDDVSRRAQIKQMLKQLESINGAVVKNIFNSLKNVQTEYLLDPETGGDDSMDR